MWFRKKREENLQPVNDTMAKRIAGLLLSLQLKFADFMSKKINVLSLKRKRLWLLVFCLLFGGFSIMVLLEGIKTNKKTIKPTQVLVPKYFNGKEADAKEN